MHAVIGVPMSVHYYPAGHHGNHTIALVISSILMNLELIDTFED
jgi:hypothetical protein